MAKLTFDYEKTKLYKCLVLVIILWQLVGIFFFSNGILRQRNILRNESDFKNSFPKLRKYKKCVFVVIDALRFDFVAHQPDSNKPYHNQLRFVNEMLGNKSENMILFKFLSEVPTVTFSRLKGLNTGSMPDAVEAGFNFGKDIELKEDNIVKQFRNNLEPNEKMVFLGDDTWEGLFPNLFDLSNTFFSFNLTDIDYVDSGIIDLFNQTFFQNNKFYAVHFLGVDHCGHKLGPNHDTMSGKLRQMDRFLEMLYKSLDNDTIVFTFGDHGMDIKGNHGGGTALEIEAALLVFSKSKVYSKDLKLDYNIKNNNQDFVDNNNNNLQVNYPDYKAVEQIDLVSTVAMITGIPIPFSNLGMMIPELFILNDNLEDLLLVLEGYRVNAHQILNYMKVLSIKDSNNEILSDVHYLDSAVLIQANKLIRIADNEYSKIVADNYKYKASKLEVIEAIKNYMNFIKSNSSLLRTVWSKFDMVYMAIGIFVLFNVSLYCFINYLHMKLNENSSQPNQAFIKMNTQLVYILSSYPVGVLAGYFGYSVRIHKLDLTKSVLLSINIVQLSLLIISVFILFSKNKLNTSLSIFSVLKSKYISLLNTKNVVAIAFLFLKNSTSSYIIFGDKACVFLLQLTFILYLIKAFSVDDKRKILYSITGMLGLYLVSFVRVYREGQDMFQTMMFYKSIDSNQPPFCSVYILCAVLCIMFMLTRATKSNRLLSDALKISCINLSLYIIYWFIELKQIDYFIYRRYIQNFLIYLIIINFCVGCYRLHQSKSINRKRCTEPWDHKSFNFALMFISANIIAQMPMGVVSIYIILAVLYFRYYVDDNMDISLIVDVILISMTMFYSTGHQETLDSIQWSIAVVGLNNVVHSVSSILVFSNTAFGFVSSALFLPSFFNTSISKSDNVQITATNRRIEFGLLMTSVFSLIQMFGMIFALILKTNLIVNRVFVPGYLFTVGLAITFQIFNYIITVFTLGESAFYNNTL